MNVAYQHIAKNADGPMKYGRLNMQSDREKVGNLFAEQYKKAYVQAIASPLAEKIHRAISLIQLWEGHALELSPDGYYVAFSGGKDSTVLEKLFRMSGVRYKAYYNNVTIDPPELVRHIKRFYPHVPWNNKETSLPLRMKKESQGPPTRLSRWCCEYYKEQGGNGLFKALGVRGPESPRRILQWQEVTQNRATGDLILCPVAYWTDEDIWAFIRQYNLPYCELYDQGYSRLGCIGCPMSGSKGQSRDFARWPRYEALWKRGFREYWDTWKGVPRLDGKPRWIEKMSGVEELWQWWRSGKALGKGHDCQIYQW